jgi:hypothetical protein
MSGELLTEFVPFPKLARLSRECVITEKIDGTNAQVIVTEDFNLLTASRSQFITPEADNHGFARWAQEHREELIKTLGPGRHFGEWWGGSINKRYKGFASEKEFSLFNTSRWGAVELPYYLNVVPVLYKGLFSTSTVWKSGSRACPGCKNPEGVVVFHVAANMCFKKTFDGDGHKGGG